MWCLVLLTCQTIETELRLLKKEESKGLIKIVRN